MNIGEFVIQLISNYGYFGMFLGMVLEAVIIVIPSEAILATGGILAGRKIFTFFGAFITGLIGSVFCAIIITLISLPIGFMRLSFPKFLIYTIIGSIPWTFVFVYVGYTLGNNWVILNQYVSKLKIPIRILLILLVISYLYKKIKPKIKIKKTLTTGTTPNRHQKSSI